MNRDESQSIGQLNSRAWDLCNRCQSLGAEMRIELIENSAGARILDFGIERTGSLAAGVSLAMICMADLADVQVLGQQFGELPFPHVQVVTDHPVAACIASQYAGWPFSYDKYQAICSGPVRLLRGKEDILERYGLADSGQRAVGVLETNEIPSSEAIGVFAEECGVAPEKLTLCLARTSSLPGTLQVVARSVETTLHKMHELEFDLSCISNALGSAPLPPIAKDDLTALGWTNDAILYGACVILWVDSTDQRIKQMGPRIPSYSSPDFGRPFLEIFETYDRDFYRIDKLLFSPAKVVINNLNTGSVFEFGEIRHDLLKFSPGED